MVILKAMCTMYGEEVCENQINQKVKQLFEVFDEDKNGNVTKEEFINGCLNNKVLKQYL